LLFFVQALQSMKQIIHNFTRLVGSTTGVVASIMVTPVFKQVAYLYYTPIRKPYSTRKSTVALIQIEFDSLQGNFS